MVYLYIITIFIVIMTSLYLAEQVEECDRYMNKCRYEVYMKE